MVRNKLRAWRGKHGLLIGLHEDAACRSVVSMICESSRTIYAIDTQRSRTFRTGAVGRLAPLWGAWKLLFREDRKPPRPDKQVSNSGLCFVTWHLAVTISTGSFIHGGIRDGQVAHLRQPSRILFRLQRREKRGRYGSQSEPSRTSF